jgi:hypothetical protein
MSRRHHAGMGYLVATDWTQVTAWATIATALATVALVLAAVIAAVLAKRDLTVQKQNLEQAQAAAEADQAMGQRQLDAQIRASADDLEAKNATQTAQEAAQHQIEASYRPS